MRVNLAERRNAYHGQCNFGTNVCIYCRDEREKVVTGHSIQECENRERDEEDALPVAPPLDAAPPRDHELDPGEEADAAQKLALSKRAAAERAAELEACASKQLHWALLQSNQRLARARPTAAQRRS